MTPPSSSRATVTIPDGCRDDLVPLSDRRAAPLSSADVGQVALSTLVAGFDWPGPDPRTHLVLATVEGRGELIVGDREHVLDRGTIAVCPAHVPRRHQASGPWRLITIRLAATERWHRFSETGPFVVTDRDPYALAAPVLGILAELPPAFTAVSGASEGRDPLDEFLARFGGQLNRDPEPSGPGVPAEPFSLHAAILRMQLEALLAGPPTAEGDAGRLLGLWEAVRREPGSEWTGETLARHLHVSRATLHRLVARHHDASPGAIVEGIRMDHASHLLAHSELPVQAIASQVGYATPYAFSAAFRRCRGTSPTGFRREVSSPGGPGGPSRRGG